MDDRPAPEVPGSPPGDTTHLSAGAGGDRTRTGATWVTALGAFMIFAAAGVFVAVRWDELADALKLAVLGALTGACLLAGQRLRPVLPATAGVLFHLGAFLVPVNVAAVAVHLDAGWPTLLLVEGVTATATWAMLGRRSRVLSWAAVAAAVVAAAGASATLATSAAGAGWWLPTSLIVAVAAVGAEVIASTGPARPERQDRPAWPERQDRPEPASPRASAVGLAWALVAGAAPVLALVERALPLGTDVTRLLGLTGRGPSLVAVATGVLAAGVVGRVAARRQDPVLVAVAAAILVVGTLTAWRELDPGAGADLVGLAAAFLGIEAVAARAAGDRFWAGPARLAAGTAEAGAALAGATGLALALVQFATQPYRFTPAPLVAGALAAAAWAVADLRRRAPGETGGTVAGPVTDAFTADPWVVPAAPPAAGERADAPADRRLVTRWWRPGDRLRATAPAGWAPATAGLVGAVLAGVLAGYGQADVVALTAVALAVAVVATGRAGGHALAVGLVVGAPLAGPVTPVAVAAGVTGAGVLAVAAVARAWWAAPPPPGLRGPNAEAGALHDATEAGRVSDNLVLAWALALGAVGALAVTAALVAVRLHPEPGALAMVLAGFAVAATAVAAVLDAAPERPVPPAARDGSPGRAGRPVPLAAVGRTAAVLVLPAAVLLPAGQQTLLAVLVGTLALVDALRLDRPGPLWAAPVALPWLVVAGARTADLGWPAAGMALGALALVCATAGLAGLPPDRVAGPENPMGPPRRPGWGRPLLATALTATFGALVLTTPSPSAFATVVILVGAIGISQGAARRRPELVAGGVLVATGGLWLHLATAHVVALDAYAAPVAAALVAAGWWAERAGPDGDHPVSSWVAYAPAVALAGGSALAERVAGGGGIHALVVGAVAVAAVIAGGSRRLIGPLAVGTALVVALTVHESLGVTRQVPTWAWLAAGGAVLVATGLWLERRETGPVEAGRRLVDVVGERFS
jgi:hypothetical protein